MAAPLGRPDRDPRYIDRYSIRDLHLIAISNNIRDPTGSPIGNPDRNSIRDLIN
jgi:hypothetical protein